MIFYPQERIAIFIDGANLYSAARGLNFDIDYKRLLDLFRSKGRLIRAFYYTALMEDQEYSPIRPLVDWLDYNGYTMVTKPTKEFTDSLGRRRIKGNMDIELAIDMLEMAQHMDHAILFSGDGDFRRLVEAVQRRGVRVSVVSTIRSSPPMASDDLRRQVLQFDKAVGLAAQIVGGHRGRGAYRRDDRHADTAPLHRLDQPAEIAVAGEQDSVVHVLSHFEHVDRQLDVHVALDPAPPQRIGELLGRLGDHGVAVVIEPIDQRPDRRIFLILHQRSIIKGADQASLRPKKIKQTLIIDIEIETSRRGIKVGAINKNGDTLLRVENHQQPRKIR